MTSPTPDLEQRLYTREHEWVEFIDGIARIGITDYAQRELGDIVFVDLPQVGYQLVKGKKLGEIESVKTVSDVFCPTTGVVLRVNSRLKQEPELVNRAAEGEGWFVEASYKKADLPSLTAGLMNATDYQKLVNTPPPAH